jgi:hypothetical protein
VVLSFYITPLVGNGTEGNPFRPATTSVRGNEGGDDGRMTPTTNAGRMLVWMRDVTPAQHTALIAINNVAYVPLEDAAGNKLDLDTNVLGDISPANRVIIRTGCENNHIDVDDLDSASPIRLLIRRMMHRFKLRNKILIALDFTEGLDTTIGAIPQPRRGNITAKLQQWGFDTSVVQPINTIREALRIWFNQDNSEISTAAD